MFSSIYLCICIYCMLQLGFLIYAENRRRRLYAELNGYFIWMLILTLFSFAADILSSFGPNPAWLFPFSAAGNYWEIILNTTLLPLFFRYVCKQVFRLDDKLRRRVLVTLALLAAASTALVISTAFTGEIFYFDEARVYHRGRLFALPMILLLVMMVIIEVFLIRHRRQIEPRYYKPLALFLVSPLIGWTLQLFVYGLPFALLGITFASLVLFTDIQNRSMDQDYLTGLFNRQSLDSILQQKIAASAEGKTFSAILLDIDNFKFINDRFGHVEGDKALVTTAGILRDSLEISSFIARYGGDEFCIILGSGDPAAVESAISHIHDQLLAFNQGESRPYQLQFSIGYAIYQPSSGDPAERFIQQMDQKMYEQKNAGRCR